MTKEQFYAEFSELTKGLAVRAIARLMDVSPSSAQRWAKGTGSPAKSVRGMVLDELRRKLAAGERGQIRRGRPLAGKTEDAGKTERVDRRTPAPTTLRSFPKAP